MEHLCDVCGQRSVKAVAASAYGPVSFGYCCECLSKGLKPYGSVVAYIASAGHFPGDINETYRLDVRRMLPLWGKTEAEFIRAVDAMIQRMEEFECP